MSSRFIQLNVERSAASRLRRGTKTDEGWKGEQEKWSGISIMSVSGKDKKKRRREDEKGQKKEEEQGAKTHKTRIFREGQKREM